MGALIEKARTLKAYPSYWGRSIFPDTTSGVAAYNKTVHLFNVNENNHRQKMLKQLLSEQKPSLKINEDNGFLIEDMSENKLVMQALEQARAIVKTLDPEEKIKNAKKDFLLNHTLDIFLSENEHLLNLALDPAFIAPIAEYLNDIPVLASIAIWYSPNDGDKISRSQLYHMDGEDSRQIKCFMPIEDVTLDNGPLTVIDAKTSAQIYKNLIQAKKVKKRNEKIPDEIILGAAQNVTEHKVVGKPGTVAFADTSRCYHYGSRPSPKPRLQLHIHYYTSASINMPVWGRDPNVPQHIKEKYASPYLESIVGLSHLDFARVRKNR